jgi:small subunit ribosomal protein S21
MTIRIKARAGESAEGMLRRFKKMCEKEGLTKDVKRQAYYEKPSEKRRRALRKAIKRAQMLALGPMVRGKPPFPPGKGPPGRNGPGGGPGGPRGQAGRPPMRRGGGGR